VWNPGPALAARLADMSPEGWRRMTCVETANAAENRVTLAPHATHTMQARLTVERL
jgi:D-hexose-6-phosphate mutarotase